MNSPTTPSRADVQPIAHCRHLISGASGGHVVVMASVTCGHYVYSVRLHYSRHDPDDALATYYVSSEGCVPSVSGAGRSVMYSASTTEPGPLDAVLLEAVWVELRRRALVCRPAEPLRAWMWQEAAVRVRGCAALALLACGEPSLVSVAVEA